MENRIHLQQFSEKYQKYTFKVTKYYDDGRKENNKEDVYGKGCCKKAVIEISAKNVGFKAGDVYQALAAAEKALTVKEIAKAANISEEETLLGMGWLFKEGKVVAAENKITLA